MYLLSQPEDSRLNEIEVARYSTDGMSSFKSGIKELKDHGYLEIRIEKINRVNLVHQDGYYMRIQNWMV